MTDHLNEPPDDLSEEARAKWRELMPLVAACGPVNEWHRDMIRQYAEAWCIRAEAIRQLKAGGPDGARYARPYFKIIEQAERVLDRVYRRLNVGFDAF